MGDVPERIRERYLRFAEIEARGRSPLYAEATKLIAADPAIGAFLETMPEPKRQPNLLLGALRYLYGTPSGPAELLELLRANLDHVAEVMRTRSTQTNEPARCATLLPVLARLPQPLALLEVGASAGLCLLPDYYGYDYHDRRISPSRPSQTDAPVFPCRTGGGTPLPACNVEVVWRAGLDLAPVDLNDAEQLRWLEALVWPGEESRIPRLRAACEIARAHPPGVIQGDLRSELGSLAARAPSDATLVVFHTAVLAYVHDPGARAAFARSVAELGAVWVANEGPGLVPGVPDHVAREREGSDLFLLCVDGRPTAWTDGHGVLIEWRSSSPD